MKNDIGSLPKWAQEYIKDLEHQRADAVALLQQFRDNQTPSKIHTSSFATLEAHKISSIKNYVQGDIIHCEHEEISLNVYLCYKNAIRLSWEAHQEVAIIPEVRNSISLATADKVKFV